MSSTSLVLTLASPLFSRRPVSARVALKKKTTTTEPSEKSFKAIKKDETNKKSQILDEEMKNRQCKQLTIFNQQQEDIEVSTQLLHFKLSSSLRYHTTDSECVHCSLCFIGTKADPLHYKSWYEIYAEEVSRRVLFSWYSHLYSLTF
ncbi:hypothetical protein YC2023_048035 [Brassica napus]